MATANVNSYLPTGIRNGFGDIAVWHLAGMLLLFAASCLNLVSLDAEKLQVKLDLQVYVKVFVIACCGIYGGLGFVNDSRVQQAALSFPGAWILLIFGLCFLASFNALEPVNALASTISILCIYLMTITVSIELGVETALKVIFYGAGLFVAGSWLAWLLFPEIGILEEPIGGGDIAVRMSGLAHPNTLGQFAGLCFVIGTVLYFSFKHQNWFVIGILMMSAAALAFSISRTAIASTVLALLVGYRYKVFQHGFSKRVLIAFAVLIVVWMIVTTQTDVERMFNQQLASFSKSGDISELSSATGRNEIWSKTIRLIRQRPILGYGSTSSKFLLAEYSSYAHNLWLNVGLNCGVGGLAAATFMCLGRVRQLFLKRSTIADSLVVFILVNGIFEDIIFSNLCGLPTICWVIGLTWFQLTQHGSESSG